MALWRDQQWIDSKSFRLFITIFDARRRDNEKFIFSPDYSTRLISLNLVISCFSWSSSPPDKNRVKSQQREEGKSKSRFLYHCLMNVITL